MSAPVSFRPPSNVDPASHSTSVESVSNEHVHSNSESSETSKALSCYKENFRKTHTPDSITIPIAVRLFGEGRSIKMVVSEETYYVTRVSDDHAGKILIDKLNQDFQATGIQFVEHSTVQFDQSCSSHISLENIEDDYKTSENYVSGAMNLNVCESEFLNSTQGADGIVAGTAITASGFMVVNSMDVLSSSVLPHETGHALGLYHTFEDFGFPFLGCNHSGDLICDTPRENSSKQNPDSQNESPNRNNFMSYAGSIFFDPRTQFTSEQAEIMRCVAAHLFE